MEVLRFIIYVIVDIFMSLVMIYCCGKIINKNIKYNNKIFTLLLITSTLTIANNLYINISFKFLIAYIIYIVVNKIVLKKSLQETIIFTTIYLIIITILELLLSCLIVIFNIDSLNLLNNAIIFKTIISIIHSIITIIIFKNKTINPYINKINTLITNNINAFLIIIVLLLNTISIYRYSNFLSVKVISFTLLISVFIIIILKITINDKHNIKVLEDKNNNLKESYKAYSNTIEECRELKHNLKNDLFSIKSLLPTDKQKIINDLIIKYNKNYDWINKIEEIPEGLQGIIFLKQNEALEKKIKIYINTSKKLETSNDDYINICSIIGILLDNAIEASSKAKKKIISINISERKSYLNIQIINKYNNNIDLNKIGKKNYSTKEIKSGIGLDYIKRIKSPKIKVEFKIINDLFISNIKYKKSTQ